MAPSNILLFVHNCRFIITIVYLSLTISLIFAHNCRLDDLKFLCYAFITNSVLIFIPPGSRLRFLIASAKPDDLQATNFWQWRLPVRRKCKQSGYVSDADGLPKLPRSNKRKHDCKQLYLVGVKTCSMSKYNLLMGVVSYEYLRWTWSIRVSLTSICKLWSNAARCQLCIIKR